VVGAVLPTRYRRGVFPGARTVGAVLDDVLAFLRPSIVHVREERQRLELTREEPGDAGRRLCGDGGGLSVREPTGWEAPRGPRRRDLSYESRGIES
jgi:hypothetical protein